MGEPISVYAKVDSHNRITELNSSLFLNDLAGWVCIDTCPEDVDQETRDRYAHAQGSYLPGPLLTPEGIPRFKLHDSQAIERTQEEINSDISTAPPLPLTETALLKAQVQALTARGDFLEDVIAELAMMVL